MKGKGGETESKINMKKTGKIRNKAYRKNKKDKRSK